MHKVLVVEDQTLLCDLIGQVLESNPALKLIGAVGDGMEAFEVCLKERPDLVILDLVLPSLHGEEIVERLKRKKVLPKILVFSGLQSSGRVKRAVELGVDGFIEKTASLAELEKAIDQIIKGQTYFSAEVVRIMRELMIRGGQGDSLQAITSREREIVKMIAESYTTKEIAQKLNISTKTAEVHRAHIMNKLNLHDVAALTRFAIANGLIKVEANE